MSIFNNNLYEVIFNDDLEHPAWACQRFNLVTSVFDTSCWFDVELDAINHCATLNLSVMEESQDSDLTKCDLNDFQFDILRSAVTIARNEHVKSLERLKDKLSVLWPDREADIDTALKFWAKRHSVVMNHRNG